MTRPSAGQVLLAIAFGALAALMAATALFLILWPVTP